jgi:hypothetical protein
MPLTYEIPREELAEMEDSLIGYICNNCKYSGSDHSVGAVVLGLRCDTEELCKRAQKVQDAILGREK